MLALVIADDLTGALDTGVAFAQCGLRTAVCTGSDIPDDIRKTESSSTGFLCPHVLCVNTESRHLPPGQAYESVFRLVKTASRQNIPCIFKKTDSALRGNVGAELAAMQNALGMEILPFVPAYPALGRTVREGVLYINGMPAASTALGHDPFNPLPSSSVVEILKATAPDITSASGNTIVSGNMPAFKGIQVYDAVTEDDLRQAGDLLADAALRSAGCGGFAKILAEKLRDTLPAKLQKTSDIQSEETERSSGHGFLVVCGSLHETSLMQVRTAVAKGVPGHILLQELAAAASQAPATDEPADPQKPMSSSASLVRRIAGELDDPGISILCSSDYSGEHSGILCTAATGSSNAAAGSSAAASGISGFNVASCLSGIVRELAQAGRIVTLCVFGGDSLSAIMRSLEVSMICIDRELYPGIVSGQISFRGQRIRLISKAGSFGDSTLIQNLRNVLS